MASSPESVSSPASTINTPSPPVPNILDPYYIHPNENPSLVLVSPVLDGPNYHRWVQSMTMALEMKNKFVFVDGSIQRPEITDPKFPSWKRCNMLALSWINHALCNEISSGILWISEAYTVWKDLRNRFSQGDHTRIAQLQREVFSMQQGDLSVSAYYTKLRMSWDELCNFRPIPICCSAMSCCCNGLATVSKYQENDSVLCFLQGLNDNFDQVRSHIYLMEPLPPLAKTYAMIVQRKRHISNSPSPNTVTALNIQTAPNSNSNAPPRSTNTFAKGKFTPSKPNRLCTHCNCTNHTIDTCWLKHGYPPGFKNKRTINNVTTETPQETSVKASSDDSMTFTREQFHAILALLPGTPPTATTTSNLVSAHNVTTLSLNQGNSLIIWIVDTGATDHITSVFNFFISYRRIKPIVVSLPDGSVAIANDNGTICLTDSLFLYDVLYVPSFKNHLISVAQLTDSLSCQAIFDRTCGLIQDLTSMKMLGKARRRGRLYTLETCSSVGHPPLPIPHCINTVRSSISQNLWHHRLGHPSTHCYTLVQKIDHTIPHFTHNVCDACHFAKQKKLPFPNTASISSFIFDLIHVDIWGPYAIPSLHGHKYFLTIVDDKSRHTWLRLMKTKSETRTHLTQFINLVHTQFGMLIKTIRSDNGVEFTMPSFYASKGIIHQHSCTETPQQNGVVERKHQHILNVARSLMFQSNLPIHFWDFAVVHAVHLINILPSPKLNSLSPHFLLHNKHPNFSALRVFGSLCFASTHSAHRTKFQPRARKCVHIGHLHGVKGYLLYDLNSKEIFYSRNVSFYENIFPYITPTTLENRSPQFNPLFLNTSKVIIEDLNMPPTPSENDTSTNSTPLPLTHPCHPTLTLQTLLPFQHPSSKPHHIHLQYQLEPKGLQFTCKISTVI